MLAATGLSCGIQFGGVSKWKAGLWSWIAAIVLRRRFSGTDDGELLPRSGSGPVGDQWLGARLLGSDVPTVGRRA